MRANQWCLHRAQASLADRGRADVPEQVARQHLDATAVHAREQGQLVQRFAFGKERGKAISILHQEHVPHVSGMASHCKG